MTFGEKFKQRREKKGLTQLEVAVEFRLAPATIWRWEAERAIPHRSMRVYWLKRLHALEAR